LEGKDFVFNLAGQVSHTDSIADPLTDLDINLKSNVVLLDTVRELNPNATVVFTSTRQVYGKPLSHPVCENHPINPTDSNGIHKFAAEQYYRLYHDVYGLKTVILRLTNTYGPRQLIKNAKQGFIGWFVGQIVRGERIGVFGDGRQKRDMTFIDDVVSSLLLSACTSNAFGKIFNLGGEVISLLDLVEMMIAINGSGGFDLIPFPEARKAIDIGDYYADYSLIKEMVGWSPMVPIESGLERMIDYYRNYGKYYL
jgi:UDP-glucose 4-epimerase